MHEFGPEPTIEGNAARVEPPRRYSRSMSPATQFSSTPGRIARAAACCASIVFAIAFLHACELVRVLHHAHAFDRALLVLLAHAHDARLQLVVEIGFGRARRIG
jgi:hypothetical protein